MGKNRKNRVRQTIKQLLLLPPPKDEILTLQKAIEKDYTLLEKDTKIVKGVEQFLSNEEITKIKTRIALAEDKLEALIKRKQNESSTVITV